MREYKQPKFPPPSDKDLEIMRLRAEEHEKRSPLELKKWKEEADRLGIPLDVYLGTH